MNAHADLLELADAYLDGSLTAEHLAVLERRLCDDPQACRVFWTVVNQELLLRRLPRTALAAHTSLPVPPVSGTWWRDWRRTSALAAAALLLIALGLGWSLSGTPAAPVVAHLAQVSAPGGPAGERVRAGARVPLAGDLPLSVGDRVELSAGASAEVRLGGEDTVFALGSGSRFTIVSHADGAAVRLDAGSLDATVAPQSAGRQVTVSTAEAVITVLGTRFAVAVAAGRTSVEVDHGRVRVTATDQSTREITTGESALALAGQPLSTTLPTPTPWTDRRPLGVMMLCRNTPGWPGNPRGWFADAKLDVRTPAGRAALAARLDSTITTTIANLRALDAQGVVFWDLEGLEHAPGYVGDPRLLPVLAPEMDALVDRMFQRLRDAGFAVGVTIRTEAVDLPASGGLTLRRLADPVREVQARIAYARSRFGATIFPLLGDGGSALTMTTVCRRVRASEPDVLLIPTGAGDDTWEWGAPWRNLAQPGSGGSPEAARARFARAFAVYAPLEREQLRDQRDLLIRAVRAGDVLSFRAWHRGQEHEAISDIYRAATTPAP